MSTFQTEGNFYLHFFQLFLSLLEFPSLFFSFSPSFFSLSSSLTFSFFILNFTIFLSYFSYSTSTITSESISLTIHSSFSLSLPLPFLSLSHLPPRKSHNLSFHLIFISLSFFLFSSFLSFIEREGNFEALLKEIFVLLSLAFISFSLFFSLFFQYTHSSFRVVDYVNLKSRQ